MARHAVRPPLMDDRGTVGAAIHDRMRKLNMSTAYLARETGLSDTTILYLGRSNSEYNRSALLAISAVLRWRYDHPLNILYGEPHKNVAIKPPLDHRLRQILHSEISPLKEKIAALEETIHGISRKPICCTGHYSTG
jgi:hypothetical protein